MLKQEEIITKFSHQHNSMMNQSEPMRAPHLQRKEIIENYQLAWPQPQLASQTELDLIPSLGQGYYCIQISVCNVCVCLTRIRVPFQKSNFYITQQAEIQHAAYTHKNMMIQGLQLAINQPLASHLVPLAIASCCQLYQLQVLRRFKSD